MSQAPNIIKESQFIDLSSLKQKQILIKCCGNNQAIEICTNQICQSNSIFTCGSHKCKCKEQHKLCLKADLYFILEMIQQKIQTTDEIKNYVQEKIERIIDQISVLKEHLLDKIEKDIKYTRLFDVQRKLLDIIYEPQKGQAAYKSQDSALLWKIINSKNKQSSKIFQDTKELLNKLQKQSKQNIQEVQSSLASLIQNQIENKVVQLSKFARTSKLELTKSEQHIILELTNKSSICKTEELSERLIKFFSKRLKKMELLFKASEHGFKIAKFYEYYGLATHTIVLCQSNKGKIVGGYTPFSHTRENLANDMWVHDSTRQSFMFSVSNNHKFFLNNKNNALFYYKNKSQIRFGNGQISILDNAYTNTSCQLYCNNYYVNQNYSIGDKDSYISFNGNQTCNCTLNEWQVWKVEME